MMSLIYLGHTEVGFSSITRPKIRRLYVSVHIKATLTLTYLQLRPESRAASYIQTLEDKTVSG
jgi:hypothetical protein